MLYLNNNQKFFYSADDLGSGGAGANPPAGNNTPAADGAGGAGGQQQNGMPEWVKDPEKAYEAIQKDRKDAEVKRKRALELEAELAAVKAEQAEALKAKGDFEKLYGQIEPEWKELKAQAEQFTAYKAAFEEMFKARMKDVPQHIKDLLADRDPLAALTWLEKNADKLKPPAEPNLDAGKTGARTNGYLGSKEHVESAMKKLRLKR